MIYKISLFRFLIVFLQNLVFIYRETLFVTKGNGYDLLNQLNLFSSLISIIVAIGLLYYIKDLYFTLIYFITLGNIFIYLSVLYDLFLIDLILYIMSELWSSITIAFTSWSIINSSFKSEETEIYYRYFILTGNIAIIITPFIGYYCIKIIPYIIFITSISIIYLTIYLKKSLYNKQQKKISSTKLLSINIHSFYIISFSIFYTVLFIKNIERNLYNTFQNIPANELISVNHFILSLLVILLSCSHISNFVYINIIYIILSIMILMIHSNIIIFLAPIIIKSFRYSLLDKSFESFYTKYDASSQNIIKIGVYIIITRATIFLSYFIFTYLESYINMILLTLSILYVYNILTLKKYIFIEN